MPRPELFSKASLTNERRIFAEAHDQRLYLARVSATPSLRKFLLHLAKLSPAPGWLLLHSSSSTRLIALDTALHQVIEIAQPARVYSTLAKAPLGGQITTDHADWVQALAHALFKPKAGAPAIAVLILAHGSTPVGAVIWDRGRQDHVGARLEEQAPVVRQSFRQCHLLGAAEEEIASLRWVLARADRRCAAVRAGGVVLGSTPIGADFLKSLAHGDRHFYHVDNPMLPAVLAAKIRLSSKGQVKIGPTSTARFETLTPGRVGWSSIVGIEFFCEPLPGAPLPLSRLSPVERDVFEHLSRAETNRTIAESRGVSAATVKVQVSEVLRKLGASRRSELIMAQVHHLQQMGPVSGPASRSPAAAK